MQNDEGWFSLNYLLFGPEFSVSGHCGRIAPV